MQRFGLMYILKDENGKRLRGQYGVPLKRLYQFLTNDWKVAEYFWRDEDEAENEHSENRLFLREIPKNERWFDHATMMPTFVEFETSYDFDNDFFATL